MGPGLQFKVSNELEKNGTDLSINLSFDGMNSFSPEAIVEQVPALKELLEIRNQITEIEKQANKYPQLEALLQDVFENPENMKKLISEIKQIKLDKLEQANND